MLAWIFFIFLLWFSIQDWQTGTLASPTLLPLALYAWWLVPERTPWVLGYLGLSWLNACVKTPLIGQGDLDIFIVGALITPTWFTFSVWLAIASGLQLALCYYLNRFTQATPFLPALTLGWLAILPWVMELIH